MLDCGFTCSPTQTGGEKFYALTSINTVEICYLEQDQEAMFFTCISRYQHQVDYLIGVQLMLLPGSSPKTVLHAGNNRGEVFLYEIDLSVKQETDNNTGQLLQSPLRLLDMIITD